MGTTLTQRVSRIQGPLDGMLACTAQGGWLGYRDRDTRIGILSIYHDLNSALNQRELLAQLATVSREP